MTASRELDIIVWDKSNHAALFESGRFAIVSPKSVIGVVEVKTTLDGGEAADAAVKIRSAKELLPPDARTPMFGAIFGYKTASTFDSLLRGVQTGVGTTERDLLSRLAPDMVVTLDRPLLSVAGSVRLVVSGQPTEIPVLVNYVPTVTGPEGRTENLGPMSLLAQLLFGIDHFWVREQSVAEALITDAPDVVQGVAAQYSGFGRGEPLIWTLGVLTPDEEVRMNEVMRLWGESLASQ